MTRLHNFAQAVGTTAAIKVPEKLLIDPTKIIILSG